MKKCIKCSTEMQDASVFCPMCGKKQTVQARQSTRRGNGEGSVCKRGKNWEAAVVLGYKSVAGRAVAIRRTKCGFKTKKEALEYLAVLRKETPKRAPTINDLWYRFTSTKQYEKLSDSRKQKYAIVWRKVEAESFCRIDQMTVSELQSIVDGHAKTYYPARDIKDLLSKLYQLAMPPTVRLTMETAVRCPSLSSLGSSCTFAGVSSHAVTASPEM